MKTRTYIFRKLIIFLGFTSLMLAYLNCSGSESSVVSNNASCEEGEILNPFGTCVLESPSSIENPSLSRESFLTGLSSPWDMAFLEDGTLFFTEKCRGLSVRLTDGTTHFLFGTSGAALEASDIFCQGQSGVNGVAVDPEFSNNRWVYIFTTSNLSTNPRTNRVIRLKVSEDLTSVFNRQDIVTDIAFKNSGNDVGGAGAHSGGRLRFGPGGYLFITTGDNHNGPLPQDLNSLGGKVLRVDRNGNAGSNNNTPTGGDPRIFTYGHRNVQGLSFHPITARPFVAEHGPGHSDEVTALVAGGNAGWDPRPNGGVTCPSDYCGYTTNKPSGVPTPMTDFQKFPEAMPPLWTNDGDSDGMGPCQFLSGAQWKAWHTRLAVGIMGARRLDLVEVIEGDKLGEIMTLDFPDERVRSLVQGPNGNLFVMTDSGNIWELQPN